MHKSHIMPMLAVAILREAASDQDMKNGARAFTATARTPTEVADALPWIRKDVDVIRMHRLSLYILIVAIVVLWPGEVAQEPQVGDGLEKEERTFAALAADKLHRPVLAQLFGEQKRDEAIVEAPVTLVVAVGDELDGLQQISFDLRECLRASIDLNTRNAERECCAVWSLADQ